MFTVHEWLSVRGERIYVYSDTNELSVRGERDLCLQYTNDYH